MPKPADKTQIEKFREAARKAETDDREEAFDAAVRKITKSPLPKEDKKHVDK